MANGEKESTETISFDSVESLQKLVTELTNLKNILKCPICLDVINDPLQISCGHIFCEDCLDTHKGGKTLKPSCPVCRKVINRQKKKPRDKIEHLSTFLKGVSEKSKNLLGCDILSTERVVNLKNKRKARTICDHQQATISKSTKYESLKPRKSFQEQRNYKNETRKDAFDVLKETSADNPFFKKNIKTYSRRKKVDNDVYKELISFEDEKFRVKIIDWLYDTSNEFDRLSQTESNNNDDDLSSTSSFDMPSVSQVQEYDKNNACRRRRTQSLGAKLIQVTKSTPKKLKRRFSEGSLNDIENLNIEEVESEENVLEQHQVDMLHILEENCLNTIESEMLIKAKGNDKTEPQTSESKSKRNNNKNLVKGNTGWRRIREINKTMSKNDRKPKKLQVSLTSSAKRPQNKKPIAIKKNTNLVKGEKTYPFIILEKLSCEVELRKADSEDIIEPSNNVYPVRDLESFISKNIQHCTASDKDSSTEIQINDNKNKKDVLKDCDEVKRTTSDKNLKENIQSKQINNSDCKDENEGSEELWDFICTSEKKRRIIESDDISMIEISEDTVDVFEIPTQQINESVVDPVEKSLIALFSSQRNSKSPNKSIDISSKIREGINIINNFEENAINSDTTNIKEFITKLKTILYDLKSLDVSSSSASSFKKADHKNRLNSGTQTLFDAKSIAVQTDAYESSGFKISSTADFVTLNKESVAVQTDDICSTPISVTSGISDVESEPVISNEQFVDHLRKQNYEFTQSMDNIDFDTQAALRIKKKSNVEVMETNVLQENPQGIRSAKKKLTYNYVPRIFDEIDGVDENEIEGNITVISIESTSDADVESNKYAVNNANKSNEVVAIVQENIQGETLRGSNIDFSLSNGRKSNQTNAPIKTYKRIRIPDDDDVNTEEIVKRIKRKEENPYVVENLSVEILSEDENMQNSPAASSNCNSVNYDDYLDKMLRQYKSNPNSRTSTQKKEVFQEPTTTQTKSQEIIKKCDALIREATAVSPVSKKKDTHNKYAIEIDGALETEFDLPFEEIAIENEISSKLKENKKFSESLFKSQLPNVLSEPPFSNQDVLAEEFDTELELPNTSVCAKGKSVGEINVLQNVLLQQEENNDESSELRYNLDEELHKLDSRDAESLKSEEMFSESDNDIIETTPRKAAPPTSILRASQLGRKSTTTSQNLIQMSLSDNDSPDVISSLNISTTYLNEIFTPPTDFQDDNDANNDKENTLDKTLVPEIESNGDDVDLTLTENLINLDQNMTEINLSNNSQLLSSSYVLSTAKWNVPNTNSFLSKSARHMENKNKTMNVTEEVKEGKSQFLQGLSLSPIKGKPIDLNPIERALRSKFSPLEIITAKSQPKKPPPVITSTPRQKSILNYVKNRTPNNNAISEPTSTTQITPYQPVKPCIACTRLGKEQMISISALTNKKLATYSNTFSPSVTHMIVSVNNNKCVKDHTMKFIFAVAAGIWITSFDWIQECLVQNQIVPEEEYEVLDVSGKPGPKIARLSGKKNKLLQNFRIHVTSPFLSTTKKDMEDLIRILGGEIVPSTEHLRENRGIRLIISEAKATQSFEIFEVWLEELKVLSVDIEWLSRSVSQYELLSLKPFLLCSDDTINHLNYPPELIHDTPFSFSQSVYNG